MLLRYSSARPAPTLLIMHIDWGFLIFGTLLGDSGSGFYGEAFHASLSSSLFFSVFGFWEKSCGFYSGLCAREKGSPMGTYEEMGKGRIELDGNISG